MKSRVFLPVLAVAVAVAMRPDPAGATARLASLLPNGPGAFAAHPANLGQPFAALRDDPNDGDLTYVTTVTGQGVAETVVAMSDSSEGMITVTALTCLATSRNEVSSRKIAPVLALTDASGRVRVVKTGPTAKPGLLYAELAGATIYLNPFTNEPLTRADVDGAECGIRTFDDADGVLPSQVRTTQVRLQVSYDDAPPSCEITMRDTGAGQPDAGSCQFSYKAGQAIEVEALGSAPGTATALATAGVATAACSIYSGSDCVKTSLLPTSWAGIGRCMGEGAPGAVVRCLGVQPAPVSSSCHVYSSSHPPDIGYTRCQFACVRGERVHMQVNFRADSGKPNASAQADFECVNDGTDGGTAGGCSTGNGGCRGDSRRSAESDGVAYCSLSTTDGSGDVACWSGDD